MLVFAPPLPLLSLSHPPLESVEELTPAARVTAMETDSKDPKFPDDRAAETPESASVEHLATRSTDQGDLFSRQALEWYPYFCFLSFKC